MINLDSILNQRYSFANKCPYGQGYVFSSSHVWMWVWDHKEDWALKNWCFQIVVLDKTLESPLDSRDIKPVNPKGNQPWIFIGSSDAEAEATVFWSSDAHRRLTGKVPDTGKDQGQKKRASEDEMAGWHHRCNELNSGKLWEMVRDREARHVEVHGVTKSQTGLGKWTTTMILLLFFFFLAFS